MTGKTENMIKNAAFRFCAWGLFAVAFLMTANQAEAKYASFVIDAESGAVLHDINGDTRNYPASLTKMMTLYMVFEAIEEGRISFKDKITISARAARQPSSKLGLRRGQTITVRNAIMAVATKSANDIASAVAEHLSGTERKFAQKMTARARRLGMKRTTFRNASGLAHRGQLSSARDMATLAMRLLRDFPQHYHYFSTAKFSYDGLTHKNHNQMLKTYDGTDGIKTGYIRASGYNLVTSAVRGGQRLIGVVFGGRTARSRNRHMAKLLDRGFLKIGQLDVADGSIKAKAKTKPYTRKKSKPQWGIQVGAYKTYEPAYKIARKAIEKAPDILFDGRVRIVSGTKSAPGKLYRARILGLSKKQARRACRILKIRKINCMELRVRDDPQELANAG